MAHCPDAAPQSCSRGEATRRSVLGRSLRTVAGLGGMAAMGSGVAGLIAPPGQLVGRAEGAESPQATPSLQAAAERARQATPRLVRVMPADKAEWEAFRSRFVAPDGRVIDTGNGGVSHTEGQGWGMLFAASYDDHPTFERIRSWTNRTLARRGDALHAWRYVPGAPQPVADLQ